MTMDHDSRSREGAPPPEVAPLAVAPLAVAPLAVAPLAVAPLAVVTGGSRGIGRAIALGLAGAGARVVLAARGRAALGETARAVAAAGGTAIVVEADVARERDAKKIAEAVDAEGGRLDVLVNNAGLFRAAPFLETQVAECWDRVIAVNLTGTFLVTRALLPALLRAPRPHVFNVLSVAALRGFPWNAAYGAAKWGARGLTEVLRAEHGEKLRVTALCPGATDTESWDGAPFPHDRSKMLRPEEVAAALLAAWRAVAAPAEIVLETPPGAVG